MKFPRLSSRDMQDSPMPDGREQRPRAVFFVMVQHRVTRTGHFVIERLAMTFSRPLCANRLASIRPNAFTLYSGSRSWIEMIPIKYSIKSVFSLFSARLTIQYRFNTVFYQDHLDPQSNAEYRVNAFGLFDFPKIEKTIFI